VHNNTSASGALAKVDRAALTRCAAVTIAACACSSKAAITTGSGERPNNAANDHVGINVQDAASAACASGATHGTCHISTLATLATSSAKPWVHTSESESADAKAYVGRT
jgi:hypothetical protein